MKIKKVIIGKGEMPSCCNRCDFLEYHEEPLAYYCDLKHNLILNNIQACRHPDCPLEEVSDD